MAEAWYVAPLLKLYVTPLVGLVTVIVPVAVAHVVCTIETVGTEGVTGCVFIVAAVAVEVQLDAVFFTIT